jgi:surface antigen
MREIVFVVAIALASPALAQMDGMIDDRPALDPRNRQLFTEALNKAMAHQAGSVSEWNDPASQTHGQVLTGEIYERKGSVCRSFDHTVFIDEQVWSYSGIACKGADGTWAEDGWLSNGQFVKSTDAPARRDYGGSISQRPQSPRQSVEIERRHGGPIGQSRRNLSRSCPDQWRHRTAFHRG